MQEIPNKVITIDQVFSFYPCYEEDKFRELHSSLGYPEEMTIEEILHCDYRPEDILWLILRPEIIPERLLHELSIIFAERSLMKEVEAGRFPDPRSWWAVNAKKLWLQGKISDEELEKARAYADAAAAYAADAADAAYAAAAAAAADADAAAYAAYAAAYAAYAAAYAAAAAAYAADAADAAAYAAYAAADAERKQQVQDIIDLLKGD
jgi:hypothetical protein